MAGGSKSMSFSGPWYYLVVSRNYNLNLWAVEIVWLFWLLALSMSCLGDIQLYEFYAFPPSFFWASSCIFPPCKAYIVLTIYENNYYFTFVFISLSSHLNGQIQIHLVVFFCSSGSLDSLAHHHAWCYSLWWPATINNELVVNSLIPCIMHSKVNGTKNASLF